MTRTLTVNLPFFPGFYESELSETVDYAESFWCENVANESDHESDEQHFPEPIRLDESELAELLFNATSYQDAYRQIARDYVDAFDYVAGEAFGLFRKAKRQRYDFETGKRRTETYDCPSIRATFESMDSPREYNFTTDRAYVEIPLAVMRDLFRRSKAEKHATLRTVITERHTSRSGFISFYGTNAAEWIAKPLTEWDHNELGTLLVAALRMADLDPDSYEWRDSIRSEMSDECGYQAWELAVDWPAFEKARTEKRAEKLAAWIESDCAMAKAWRYENGETFDSIVAADESLFADFSDIVTAPVRCPNTPDLFDKRT